MSKYKKCKECSGSGKVMGGGMIQKDCEECDGKGKHLNDDDFDKFNVESSESYDNAIKSIQEKCGVDRPTAKELFDNEIKNQTKIKRKN